MWAQFGKKFGNNGTLVNRDRVVLQVPFKFCTYIIVDFVFNDDVVLLFDDVFKILNFFCGSDGQDVLGILLMQQVG